MDAKPVVYEYLTNEYTGEDKEELLETYRDRIEREEVDDKKSNMEQR